MRFLVGDVTRRMRWIDENGSAESHGYLLCVGQACLVSAEIALSTGGKAFGKTAYNGEFPTQAYYPTRFRRRAIFGLRCSGMKAWLGTIQPTLRTPKRSAALYLVRGVRLFHEDGGIEMRSLTHHSYRHPRSLCVARW